MSNKKNLEEKSIDKVLFLRKEVEEEKFNKFLHEVNEIEEICNSKIGDLDKKVSRLETSVNILFILLTIISICFVYIIVAIQI